MTFQLGFIDLVVLLVYLATAIFIGVVVRGKSKDIESYLLGDRNLPWWAILGSIVATETSTATVLSVPGEASGIPGQTAGSGFLFLQLALGYIIGRTIIVCVLLPLYFRGKLFTAYQVLDQRFGQMTRQAASLLFLVTRNLGDGLRLFLAAIVLQELAGLPFVWSVVAMGAVTIVYTFLGGMRSVVWNDCIQLVIYMLGGIAAVFIIAASIDGGWQELFRYAREHDKFRMFDLRLLISEPYTLWAGLIGGAVLTIGTHGTDHMMVQRYLSARSQTDAGRAVLASGLVVFVQFALFLFIGIELSAYYAQHPEFEFAKADKVFAHFIGHAFPQGTGLVGLMLAAILASAMSTLSSSLNSSASALVNDFYVPWRRKPATPEHLFFVTRGLTVVFGVLQTLIGIWALGLGETVVKNALTIAGFSAGLLLGVFALGVLTRRAGQTAALVGGAVGLGVLSFVQFGVPWLIEQQYLAADFKVAFPWLALIGASATFLAGWIVSWFVPDRSREEGVTP
ncbi:MAG TPA: sodium:solute symporter [Pirellulaceae bacterium]|nr:sodium:solute symporter [Pirellulaceae bacterium]